MTGVVRLVPKNQVAEPDQVLESARGEYQDVLVIGYDLDGNLDVRGSDYFADGGNLVWIIETFKSRLLSGEYNNETE